MINQVLLLANLRSNFAEFLNNSSPRSPWYTLPDHVCSFLVRAIYTQTLLAAFLGTCPHSYVLGSPLSSRIISLYGKELPYPSLLPSGDIQHSGLHFQIRHYLTNINGFRNLNLMCIGYAFWPDLSSRLTQGGRTLPWKP